MGGYFFSPIYFHRPPLHPPSLRGAGRFWTGMVFFYFVFFGWGGNVYRQLVFFFRRSTLIGVGVGEVLASAFEIKSIN